MGIVLVEMSIGAAPLADSSEIGMLFKMFRKFGTPKQALWSELAGMQEYIGEFWHVPISKFSAAPDVSI